MHIITFAAQKGGVGKSTLAVNLAVAAEASGIRTALFDLDPQESATAWSERRQEEAPHVEPISARRLDQAIDAAAASGFGLTIIDTPPAAGTEAAAAAQRADLVLIPCRPSAFDLSAIQTTAKLVQLLRKPAFVVFTAGAPNAPRVYAEAGELVECYGTPACPVIIPDRAAYRHASAEGRSVMETEPAGRAASDIRQLYDWTCRQVDMKPRKRKGARS